MNDAKTRALQFLLVQEFTLYPCAAAVCTRLVDRALLENPRHTWAAIFDRQSLAWTSKLATDDPLLPAFSQAAVASSDGATVAVCHTAGGVLVTPLTVTDVRDARLRIEHAVARDLAPTADRLEAIPDELIEREAMRRAARKEKEETNVDPQ